VLRQLSKLVFVLEILGSDCVSFCAALFRRRTARWPPRICSCVSSWTLFQEREKRARPTTAAERFVFSKLARLFHWRSALVIVKPATLIGWHRAAFRRFWRWKSRPAPSNGSGISNQNSESPQQKQSLAASPSGH
jgi:hypothetical protein